MKVEVITCDMCKEDITDYNVFEVYVQENKGMVKKYCRHELCHKCWKEFMKYLSGFKE